MRPNHAGVKFILRRGGRQFWIIVFGLTAMLLLLQLAKAAHPPNHASAYAPPVPSRELDSLFRSVLEGGTTCPEPMGEDQLAGKDPILGLVAPQVIGLDMPPTPSSVSTGPSGTGGTDNSSGLKPVHPDCPSNAPASNGAAGDGTSGEPRCARPPPTLRQFDSGQVADLRHLRAR